MKERKVIFVKDKNELKQYVKEYKIVLAGINYTKGHEYVLIKKEMK